MKSKLAIWSWVLSIIGVIVYPGIETMATLVDPRYGYKYAGNVFLSPLLALIMLVIVFTGLILGTVALKTTPRNPESTGKGHAVVGIILNILLFIYGMFVAVGGSL